MDFENGNNVPDKFEKSEKRGFSLPHMIPECPMPSVNPPKRKKCLSANEKEKLVSKRKYNDNKK